MLERVLAASLFLTVLAVPLAAEACDFAVAWFDANGTLDDATFNADGGLP